MSNVAVTPRDCPKVVVAPSSPIKAGVQHDMIERCVVLQRHADQGFGLTVAGNNPFYVDGVNAGWLLFIY